MNGYPDAPCEFLRDRTYKPAVLKAMKAFRKSHARTGNRQEREAKFQALHAALCKVYRATVVLEFDDDALMAESGDSGGSCYEPGMVRKGGHIFMTGFSVVTYLHEFAHALGKDEYGACDWSVNLFRRIFPKSFGRCHFDGHMVLKGEGRISGDGDHAEDDEDDENAEGEGQGQVEVTLPSPKAKPAASSPRSPSRA